MQQNRISETSIEIVHFTPLQPQSEQNVPDEPTKLPEPLEFNNQLEPRDLSMPRELFSDIFCRDVNGRIYIDNGTRLKCKICHCYIVFKNWKAFEKHSPSCTRKNGVVRIPRRRVRNETKEIRRFQCQLCNRKYTTHAHLFNHQVQRCEKRYVSDNWIVKI